MNHPLDELLSLVERSYVRMEAEQLIDNCLLQEDPTPFNELLEELILAGSESLITLREILGAIRSVKNGLSQEGLDVRQDLMEALAEFGVNLSKLTSTEGPETFLRICRKGLHREVMEMASCLEENDESLLEEICIEAGKRVTLIARRLALLNRLEASVVDWIDGLVYEIFHSAEDITSASQRTPQH